MTDKLRESAQQALDDGLLVGQAQHLISALMNRGFLPNNLPTAEYITLWDVVKRQLMCVNKEGARAALAQQDAQAVPSGYKLVPVEPTTEMKERSQRAMLWAGWDAAYAELLNAAHTPPAEQDAQAVPQPPMLRWRELADYPAETGRYIVAHCGQVGGHAYYTATEGDTHYPVGWAQLPDFKPTHWLDGPRIGTGDAALNAAPTPPAQQEWIDDAGRLRWALWRIKDLEQQLAGRSVAVTPPARATLTASEILNMTPESIPAEHDGALLEYARAVIEAYERKNGIK